MDYDLEITTEPSVSILPIRIEAGCARASDSTPKSLPRDRHTAGCLSFGPIEKCFVFFLPQRVDNTLSHRVKI